DYQQTKGRRSEKRIPTGKLFGLRKFDYIQTSKATGFVKGKRSTGFFAISNLDGEVISPSVNVKKNGNRLAARTTTLIDRREAHSSTGQARVVSCA
nr:HNH endonuclease [Elusimicrobiota bacterium]